MANRSRPVLLGQSRIDFCVAVFRRSTLSRHEGRLSFVKMLNRMGSTARVYPLVFN
jgi:hypothetical protein